MSHQDKCVLRTVVPVYYDPEHAGHVTYRDSSPRSQMIGFENEGFRLTVRRIPADAAQ